MKQPKKLQLASDIHLHQQRRTHEIMQLGDYLLLAGDVAEWGNPYDAMKGREFLRDMCAQFERVFYIFGNHEFYHGNFQACKKEARNWDMPKNLMIMDGDVHEDDDFVLLGHTLWTDFGGCNIEAMQYCKRRMNDFHLCTYTPEGKNYNEMWTPGRTIDQFDQGIKFIEDACEKYKDRKIVVMTHHAPAFKSVDPRYRDDPLMNLAYYTDLEQFIIERPQIKAWVHGHMHLPFDYFVGNTRVMCNPLGYHGIYNGFDPAFVFEV